MRRRWCAAGMLEAEKSFCSVKSYRQMPVLVAALQRHCPYRALTPGTQPGLRNPRRFLPIEAPAILGVPVDVSERLSLSLHRSSVRTV